ncbi:MAG: ISAs1 family transposase [Candidatus Competibacter denitrificans]
MLPRLLDPRPYLADLPDPRRETQNKLHKLHDILMIVLCAILSGVEDWVGMEAFAEEKEAWLRGFLELPNGIPSHDTLSDVMGRIDPGAFQRAFTTWARAALPGLTDKPVCIDGKAVRGSRNGAVGTGQTRRCIWSVPLPDRRVGICGFWLTRRLNWGIAPISRIPMPARY